MTLDLQKEKEFLDSLVADYTDQSPYSKAKKDVINSLIDEIIDSPNKKTALQLGCSGGYETNLLAKKFSSLDVIDGSREFIQRMKKETARSNINYIYSLFEDYEYKEQKYDYIFCNYILEHVYDPIAILSRAKYALKNDGLFFATVPNSNAFSRILAKNMGLIQNLKDLTKNDLAHGHRRVYDHKQIVKDFTDSGYVIVESKGVIFKILADFQLNEMLKNGIITTDHIFSLQQMANINIEMSDSIFIVAKKA